MRSRRKTLGITVYRDQRVVVRAPQKASIREIETIVRSRANWILKQLTKFEAYPLPPPVTYSTGETHYFLGDAYALKVIAAKRDRVNIDDGTMILGCRQPAESSAREKALKKWYRKQARRVFQERLDTCYQRASHLKIPYPDIFIRDMKTRWGSCSGRTDRINLNLKLIQTPIAYIDYVIIHELCHFREHNHSSRYYALLESIEPNWKVLRKALNQFPAR